MGTLLLEGTSVGVADTLSVSLETVEGVCNLQLQPKSQKIETYQCVYHSGISCRRCYCDSRWSSDS